MTARRLIWFVCLFLCFSLGAGVGCLLYAQEFRSIDGSNNNPVHADWGKANTWLMNATELSYGGEGYKDPGGQDRPNARAVSNAIFQQDDNMPDQSGLNDIFWNFGQFIDHDMVINRGGFGELLLVPIPQGDAFFDPQGTGNATMFMVRGRFDPATGIEVGNPRRFVNEVTAWIDGSMVYGVDEHRMHWLRTHVNGKLKVSEGNLLPFNTTTGEFEDDIDPAAPFMENNIIPEPKKYFVGGDIRINEQPGLICFHTLFVREHNRLCDEIRNREPGLSDEEIFQRARKWVGAMLQAITYEEWLPALGIQLSGYTGHDMETNPGIMNIFSAAAFRLGHSMVNEQFIRLDVHGDIWSFGSVNLRETFFNTRIFYEEGGIDPFFRGMAVQPQQQLDNKIVGSLRNFLFGDPGRNGLDLATINIMRARERGLPDYNTVRQDFGLPRVTSFEDITGSQASAEALRSVYPDVDKVDPWVGMLSEGPMAGSMVGPLMHRIIQKQFEAVRDGDRFWYEIDPFFTDEERTIIRSTRIADIIRRNTDFTQLLDEAFRVQDPFVITGLSPLRDFSSFRFELYPNPVYDRCTLRVTSEKESPLTLLLLDISGRELYRAQYQLRLGENRYDLALGADLSSGVIILKIVSESGSGTMRIVKE
jgi:hypothetical protein